MSSWKRYVKRRVIEARPYEVGEDLAGVSVHPADILVAGGMIARDPDDHDNQWYVTPTLFKEDYRPHAEGTDFLALPDVCGQLYPHAVLWRETVHDSNVDSRGVVHGEENRAEIEVLDRFIAMCRELGLDDDE